MLTLGLKGLYVLQQYFRTKMILKQNTFRRKRFLTFHYHDNYIFFIKRVITTK